jgi:hypothetical protein
MGAQDGRRKEGGTVARKNEELLAKLRSAEGAEARASVAAALLAPRNGREVVRGALHELIGNPAQAARPALHSLFDAYMSQGGSRDVGAYLRSDIVRALRPIAQLDDLDLLTTAVTTYEFPPPHFKEEAGLLRGGALVALAELDETTARYHAARLLTDPYTEPMSGEPALTAVRVLAALGEDVPLYTYAVQEPARMLPEVGGECLRCLSRLPRALVPSLVAHYADCAQPVVLLGLVDLLIQHEGGPQAPEYLVQLLQRAEDEDLYRYLVAAMLASGQALLHAIIADHAREERQAARVEVLLDLLPDAASDAGWREVVEALQARRRPRR